MNQELSIPSREIRLEKERTLDTIQGSLVGKNFKSRFEIVRKHLLGLSPDNDPARHDDSQYFASPEDIDIHFQQYSKLMDKLYGGVISIPNPDKEGASLRFGGLVYMYGIIIHPKKDGNGQSLRAIALSYIKEFAPKYKNSHFRERQYSPQNRINMHSFEEEGTTKIAEACLPESVKQRILAFSNNRYAVDQNMVDTFLLYSLGASSLISFNEQTQRAHELYIMGKPSDQEPSSAGKDFAARVHLFCDKYVSQMAGQLEASK